MKALPRRFYTRDTLTVAEELLGKRLVRHTTGSKLVGKIVEVEAYGGSDDPGSHAYRGMTPRNRLMFRKGGFAYVYFTYGKHYCFNVVTERQNVPGAVLIRALEPLEGIETMKKNRRTSNVLNLTDGPGKLTEAMNITGKQNGLDLTRSKRLFICKPEEKEKFEVASTKRIGIRVGVNKPWRFYIEDNRFVSRK
ncbi:MAG: DNA-3-methyladenine glycosylase [Candidatus Bathyarchaeota archaeon]|nr:DNA-3-methyladenine glycosylase [Candidatus Bathyarchaeota archaeon]